jgi:hypothetical protein
MLVPGLVIFFAVMRCGDTVRMRGKIVELGGSLVPDVLSSAASVAHESLLGEALVSEPCHFQNRGLAQFFINSVEDVIRRLIEPNRSLGASGAGRLQFNGPVGELFFSLDPVIDITPGLAAAQEI